MSASGRPVLTQILQQFGRTELVKIKDFSAVEDKLVKIIKSTPEALQVISDFDRTMSRHHLNGKICPPSAGIMRNSPGLPEEFLKIAKDLFVKYYAVEIDLNMSEEENIPLMVEWYQLTRENVIENSGILKSQFKELVLNSSCFLRDNADVLLKSLYEASVPVLIFSAGLGNAIQIIMEQNNVMYPNVRIVSNYIEFDEETEKIVGYSQPIIHVLNKNESVLTNDADSIHDLEHRKNVILLGDHVGDISMARGIQDLGSVIRIGFLNEKIEENLEHYLNAFDIVLVDDQSMDFVNILMKTVLSGKN